ncbi:MAG: signal peptidase I, partial [Firmicutes bacterium]|nr:signal peptidase I [Bacillota bacterium]
MAKGKPEQEKGKRVPHIVGNVIGIALIVVLLPIMIANTTLIIKSYTQPNKVPSFLGVSPLIVQSGSMKEAIQVNDLIFVKKVDPDTLQLKDIIAFQQLGETTVVTHRIVDMKPDENGRVQFITKGDNNNTPDTDPCDKLQVVGKYFGRLAGVGKVALFLQQPLGMVVCVAVPLAAFLLYDVIKRVLYNRKKKGEDDADKEELERLRALAAAVEAGEPLPVQPAASAQPEEPAP